MTDRTSNGTGVVSRMALFARNFFKYPTMLGSLIPSSRYLVNDILSQVDWARARVIVEYGPGVGTITQEILRRMRPDAVLVAIELNLEFFEFLRQEISDPRLRLVRASANDAPRVLGELGLQKADYVISGIPYSVMPKRLRGEICQRTSTIVHPNGAHLVYQFTTAVLPHLQRSFRSVERDFQPFNILPAHLYYCIP
jgi:phospholipid N-methyltransferase